MGLLAAQALRPSGCPDYGRRPQEVARGRQRAEHRRRRIRRQKPTRRKMPTTRFARFSPKYRRRSKSRSASLVDVRSPAEFTGEILSPPGLPETCQRGGHIPGAKSMPWAKLANDDGTFKTPSEIKALYDGVGVKGRQAESSPIAASASDRATAGSRSSTCSATTT